MRKIILLYFFAFAGYLVYLEMTVAPDGNQENVSTTAISKQAETVEPDVSPQDFDKPPVQQQATTSRATERQPQPVTDFKTAIRKPAWFERVEAPLLSHSGEVSQLWQSKPRCCIDEKQLQANNREFYKACYQAIVNHPADELMVVKCLWLMDSGSDLKQRKLIKSYLVENYFYHENSTEGCVNCAPADTVSRVARELALIKVREGELEFAISLLERVLDERHAQISPWVLTEIYTSLAEIYLKAQLDDQRMQRVRTAYTLLHGMRGVHDGVERRFARFERAYQDMEMRW